jgi:hypothetical protein
VTCPVAIHISRADATLGAKLSALAAVYAYLINTHKSKKAVKCAARSDDRDGSMKIPTRSKEAT